jgi:hypothetical protein
MRRRMPPRGCVKAVSPRSANDAGLNSREDWGKRKVRRPGPARSD